MFEFLESHPHPLTPLFKNWIRKFNWGWEREILTAELLKRKLGSLSLFLSLSVYLSLLISFSLFCLCSSLYFFLSLSICLCSSLSFSLCLFCLCSSLSFSLSVSYVFVHLFLSLYRSLMSLFISLSLSLSLFLLSLFISFSFSLGLFCLCSSLSLPPSFVLVSENANIVNVGSSVWLVDSLKMSCFRCMLLNAEYLNNI